MQPRGTFTTSQVIDQKPPSAIPFIAFKPGKGFIVSKEAQEFLSTLDDSPVGVISIVGKYRTGKSFFTNRVLLEQKEGSGFGVGNTINACTKGLWMWTETVPSSNPDSPALKLLVLDTEGFGGIEESSSHDTRIFLFAILLSSYFIYNSVGAIDENELQSLSLVLNLAKKIHSDESGQALEPEEIASVFPSFLWVVRDFALQLRSAEGRKINPKEYLESALQLIDGVSEAIHEKNKLRRMLKHFFTDRDCVTMVRPVESEEQLQRLNTLKDYEFRPEFLSQMENVRKKVRRRTKAKTLKSREVNGAMLLELAKAYCDTINKGAAPNIQTAWQYLSTHENHKAHSEALQYLEIGLKNIDSAQLLGKDENWKAELKKEARRQFREKALGESEDIDEFEEALEAEIEKKIAEAKKKVVGEKEHEVRKWIETTKRSMVESVKAGEIGDFKNCEDRLQELEEEFEEQFGNLPEERKEIFLSQFRTHAQKEMFSWINLEMQNRQKREAMEMELKLAQLKETKERDLKMRQQQLDHVKQRLEEAEKSKLVAEMTKQSEQERLKTIKEELHKVKEESSKTVKEHKRQSLMIQGDFMNQTKGLQQQIADLKNSHLKEMSGLEKKIGLLEQEKSFLKKDQDGLKQTIKDLKSSLKDARDEKREIKIRLDILKEEYEGKQTASSDEVLVTKDIYQNMERTISSHMAELAAADKRISEERLERQIAENKLQLIHDQMEERRKMHETVIDSLNSQLKSDEFNRSQLSMLKKQNDKELDNKLLKLEADNEKLKTYKMVMHYATSLQCANCNRFISNALFVDHINQCLPHEQNPFHNPNHLPEAMVRSRHILDESRLPVGTQLNAMTVNIPQTMVRENPATKRPYIEYIVQIMTRSCQWTVARKYREFCELHNQLTSTFPFVQFPGSAREIFGMSSNLSSMMSSRKSNFQIDDRRKCLQNYLKDLLKVDVLRNAPLVRTFLDVHKYYDQHDQLVVDGDIDDRMSSAMNRSVRSVSGNVRSMQGREDIQPEQTGSMIGDDMRSSLMSQSNNLNSQQYFLRKLNNHK